MSVSLRNHSMVSSKRAGSGIRHYILSYHLWASSGDGVRIFMPVFVDDITLAGNDGAKINSIIQELSSHFKLHDLGPSTQLLGMEIHRDRSNCTLSLSQSQFITHLVEEHGLQDCKPVSTPLNPRSRLSTSMSPQNDAEAAEMSQYPYISIVGSLMYLALTIRPDIAYAAGVLARFNSNPGLPHWQAAKHVLQYLKHQQKSTFLIPSYSILFHLTTSYSSYFGGKKGISRNKTSFFLLMWATSLKPSILQNETMTFGTENS